MASSIFFPPPPLSHHRLHLTTPPTTNYPSLLNFQKLKSSSNSTTTTETPTTSLYSEDAPNNAPVDAELAKIGARVRVNSPLNVYHIPKLPQLELNGLVGVVKQYVGVYKGKRISANLPYKVEFFTEIEGRSSPVKFFAHLKEDEFEFL